MNYKQIFAIVLCMCVALMSSAQLNLPTLKVGEKAFYYYKVADKESVHGIAQKMGVSPDNIAFYNPSATNGINKGTLIFVPVEDNKNAHKGLTTYQVNTKNKTVVYTLESGDNIYTVSKKFNTTPESLINNNISIAPQSYVAGTKVKVTPNNAMPFYYDKSDYKFYKHVVQKDESLYSIANKYGTTQSMLQQLNPELNKLKKGKSIIVPQATVVKTMGNMETIDIKDLEAYYSHRINDIYFKLNEEHRNREVNIAIVLPFQLQNENAPRQAYLYTDFLKGFMIALDSIGKMTTIKIKVKVYDTEHNLNKTDSILALPEMMDMRLILAPTEPKQFERICEFGRMNNIDVLNCFATKVEEQQNNPNLLQVNTPTPIMVNNLTSWFATRFKECSVVYLVDANNDSNEMFETIKENFSSTGVNSQTIKVDGELSFDALSREMNPGTNYVFITSNSSKSLLKKVLPALKKAKTERFDCEMNMLGYPEYILYLKDYQSDLMTVDTYMFSRFFNTKGFKTRNVENSYSKWYGGTMLDSYPNMGIFGFDVASYLINTLGNGQSITPEAATYKGIQTGFKFNREDGWEGLINEAITLVHFSTDNKIESFIVIDK